MKHWMARSLAVVVLAALASPVSAAFAYNGASAASYADTYANSYSSQYPSFANSGGDCTNFVSQALHAGGIAFRTSGSAAWYINRVRKGWSWTTSWVNAQANADWLLQNLPGTIQVTTYTGLSPTQIVSSGASQGDVVLYDWNNDGTYDHEAIVATTDGQYVDAHTNNRLHSYWTLASYNASWQTTRLTVIHIPSSTT